MTKCLDQYVRLNRETRADLEWWYCFMSVWNGVAMMKAEAIMSYHAMLTSDASGSWGCGAMVRQHWFMLLWARAISLAHITVKELTPIVIATLVWGQNWRGRLILAQCDNFATVNSGTSRNRHAMQLRCCLAYLSATKGLIQKGT